MQASEELILFTVSVLPVFLIGSYIYKKDKNKEPTKLLMKLFLGGIGACLLVVFLNLFLYLIFPIMSIEESKLNFIQLFFKVFVGIAFIEELSKWIFAYNISYNDNEFDEFYDAIVYCTFVALGFACFENLFYVYQKGLGTGVLRALFAVPGHACDGVLMGYYLGLAKENELKGNNGLKMQSLLLSILIPTATHGFYDYCLFAGKPLFALLFIIFVICVYIMVIKRVNKVTLVNKKIRFKDNFCPNCGRKVESDFCPNCGHKND